MLQETLDPSTLVVLLKCSLDERRNRRSEGRRSDMRRIGKGFSLTHEPVDRLHHGRFQAVSAGVARRWWIMRGSACKGCIYCDSLDPWLFASGGLGAGCTSSLLAWYPPELLHDAVWDRRFHSDPTAGIVWSLLHDLCSPVAATSWSVDQLNLGQVVTCWRSLGSSFL